MDIDKLAQIIEAEVRKALSPESDEKKQTDISKGNIYALFTGGSANRPEALNQVRQLILGGYHVDAILSESAARIIKADKVSEIQGIGNIACEPDVFISSVEIVQKSDLIVVPVLTRNSAAKVALGICDTVVTNIIMHALIAGKPVIAARNSADPQGADCICIGTPNTPAALIQLAKEHLKKLESYGMKLVDVTEIARSVMGNEIRQSASSQQRVLVTQETISSLPKDAKRIEVGSGSIVTPLAKDLAKERGIEIVLIKS